MTEAVPPPAEPEVEFLARFARIALLLVRGLLFAIGAVAVVGAIWLTLEPNAAAGETIAPMPERLAHNSVFVCLGLPLVLPTRWLLARRWMALALFAACWLGPMLLEGDHDWGVLIRMFATFVACASVLVLRTLRGLTAHGAR
jgi:hypothetical protein